MKKNKSFAEKAYRYTRIDAGMTQRRIEDMLAELGISNIRITRIGSDYTVEFIAQLKRDEHPRKVRMNIPIDSDLGEDDKSQERQKNKIFRVLYWHLKSKFVSVQNGLKEFEAEFLDDIVIIHNGKEMRIGDVMVPEIKRQLMGSDRVLINITK